LPKFDVVGTDMPSPMTRNTAPDTARSAARLLLKPPVTFGSVLRLVILVVFLLPIAARAVIYVAGDHPRDWRAARWNSAGLLPPAEDNPEARVLIFSAPNGSWRSIFAVHTWIVVKPAQATRYTRYDVIGFGAPLRIDRYAPDGYWFGSKPTVVADVRGKLADAAIPKIEAAVRNYAFAKDGDYRLWPGPNSNTFVATVLRAVPQLRVEMPATAIGKDFRADYSLAGFTPSRTGFEVEVLGLFGVKAAWVEGIEFNFFSLVAGLDLRRPGLKLPGFGRIGTGTGTFETLENLPSS
jgi:hypothetical protein